MTYYWLNRKEILQKAKERYSKEKAAVYYFENKEAIKKDQWINTETCHKKKKTRLKSTKRKDISNWFSTKKKYYKINELCFCSLSEWVKNTKIWQY